MSLPASFDELTLDGGAHDARREGMCAMEAAAWFAGEEHTDHPKCVEPSITALMIGLNDACEDDQRDAIVKPLIPLCLDTRPIGRNRYSDFEERFNEVHRLAAGQGRFVAGAAWPYGLLRVDVRRMYREAQETATNRARVDLYPEVIRELCTEARRRLDRESSIVIPEDFGVLEGMKA